MNKKAKKSRKKPSIIGAPQILWPVLVVFCLVSCQLLFQKRSVIPKNLSAYKKGAFSGPVTFYQNGKKYYFQADILVWEKDQIRMDFSVGPTVPVLTFVWSQKHITALMLREKTFYKGPWASFHKHGVEFLPESALVLLSDLLFDRPPVHADYKCQKNPAGLPLQCHNQKWQLQWQRKKKRLLSLKQAGSEWQFQYAFFSPEVDKTQFDIVVPKNFKPIFLMK